MKSGKRGKRGPAEPRKARKCSPVQKASQRSKKVKGSKRSQMEPEDPLKARKCSQKKVKASQLSQMEPEEPLKDARLKAAAKAKARRKALRDASLKAAKDAADALKAAEALMDSWRAGRIKVRMPVIPQPATELKEDFALPVGPDYLLHLHRRFFERMGPECRSSLKQYVQETLCGRWNAATACSGSDGPLLAWEALSQVLKADMDVTLSVSHAFSAEKEEPKRDFIRSAL